MSQLTDRLERDLREIAAGAHPSPSAWESIVARFGDDGQPEVAVVLAPVPDRSKRPVWIAVAAAALVVITGSIAVLVIRAGDDVVPTIPPTAEPFVGIWVSTDTDGSSQTMEIVRSGGDNYEFVLRDDFASTACSGAPATMTGTGLLETDERLVIAQPELTCDDGTIPANGAPPQAELANFTFDRDPVADELTDRFGVVWRRAVVDFPNLTTTFISPRNGFSIKRPDRVVLTPAKDPWEPGNELVDVGVDVVETGFAAVFKGASIDIPDPLFDMGYSLDQWVDEAVSPGGCGVPRSQQAEIIIDGQAGRISECPNEIGATVVGGGRIYLFTLLHDRSDARAVFDAFVATIDLTPRTAVDIPNLMATFVSPTNGYSFKYRGTLTPAKELWDPVNTPPIDERNEYSDEAHYRPFDLVETGMGAFFTGASTKIPDGISIDEWVDEYVSPGSCATPRSQQAEIIIDGQSGRFSECLHEIEATVVVDGRLYFFTLLHRRSDARAFFDAYVATIDLRPAAAAVP